MAKISLVTTVLNEQDSIEQFLQSIAKQSRRPDEFIIVDGGSTDKTIEKIKLYARKQKWIKLIISPGAPIGAARNQAINKTKNEVIASTDAGTILHPDWLKELVRPILENRADVSAGLTKPCFTNDFEYFQGRVVQPEKEAGAFRPGMSTRSLAFKKTVWKKAGGFPAEFGGRFGGEDTLFAIKVSKSDFKQVYTPKAIVYWRMRPTLAGFASQFYRYAAGDKKIGNLSRLPANLALIVGFWAWILAMIITTTYSPVWTAILLALLPLYAIYTAVASFIQTRRPAALYYTPLLSITKRLAYIMGATFG